MIDLSIITVSYNSEKFIRRYIASLNNLPSETEVIVVDCDSTDHTVEILKNESKVKLIEAGGNIGFGAGNNLGVKHSNGKYLLFLNPDTQILDDAINIMLLYLKSQDKIGILAPAILDRDSKVQASVRRLPTIYGAIKEYYFSIKDSYKDYIPSGTNPTEVEAVYGAAMMMNRKTFNGVGGFDKKYFMYFEDLDLCRKVKRLGLRIIYLPKARIKHEVGGSFSLMKEKWLNESSRIYHGLLKSFLLYIILRFRPKD